MMSRWKRHSVDGFSGPDHAPYSPLSGISADHLRPQQVVGDRALGVISIASPMRAEMLPAVPDIKPAAFIARHWATIAARRSFSLVPIRVPHSRPAQRWRPSRPMAVIVYTAAASRKRPRVARAARPISAAAAGVVNANAETRPAMLRQSFRPAARARAAPRQAGDRRARRPSLTYGELFARAGRAARALVESRRRAGRPRRGADRQVARRDRAGARLLRGRRGAAAAQHRLYARRARVFPRRRRAGADDVPPGSARGRARDRRQARPRRGRKPRRATATGASPSGSPRRATNCRRSRAATTISPRSSTPPAPPGAPRARC